MLKVQSQFSLGQRVLEMSLGSFLDTSAPTSARAFWSRKEGKLRWKLFHSEELATPERHIINAS